MMTTNDKNNIHDSTKLVIITSDDDLIHRITDTIINHQTTQIFHFNGKSNTNANSHGEIDNETKRTSQSKSNRTTTRDLICVVCGGHAIANNYNAMTCGSCKIFFHRHAFGSVEQKRCLTGNGDCPISHDIQRKCIRCRLQRCFAAGMTTDYFLTDKEKERRRKRYKNNPQMIDSSLLPSSNEQTLTTTNNSYSSAAFDEIDQILFDLDRDTILIDHDGESHFRTLPIEEYSSIESLQTSFSPIFHTPSILNDRISLVAEMTQSQSNDILKLINVFRQINEFNALHDDDRFILIKYNLFSLYLLRKCLAFDPVNQTFLETSDDLNTVCRFFSISPGSEEKSVYFIQWINSMCQVTEQDKTLVQLLLVVLLFSKGMSMIEDEPFLHDSIAVNRAQIHYTHLIWNLFINKWGYERAVNHSIQLLNLIFRLQTMTKLFRSFLKDQIAKPDTIDHIAPLMQTVPHISETN